MIFFVLRGCVIFFCPERLGEFFWSREVRFAISEIWPGKVSIYAQDTYILLGILTYF